jgi:hypothetical protein
MGAGVKLPNCFEQRELRMLSSSVTSANPSEYANSAFGSKGFHNSTERVQHLLD